MAHVVDRKIGTRFSRSLALSLTWISLAAAAEVTVKVERQENAFQVEANLLVAVDAAHSTRYTPSKSPSDSSIE